MKQTTRARAMAGRQKMISSRYEEFCVDCMRTTDHEFLASNTVQCKECFRLTFVSKPMIAVDIRR